MVWTLMVGSFQIELSPAALIVSAAVLAGLLATRHYSLSILEEAPDFRERERYMRGARWAWLFAVGGFVVVVLGMTVLLEHAVWDFRATALAWAAAIFPLASSAGLLMMEEFMGYWVWAQVVWDALGGRRIDWMRYRAITERVASGSARWAYYGAWVIGSVGLTIGPLLTYAMVRG